MSTVDDQPSPWSVLAKYPLQTLAHIVGGSLVAAAIGFASHDDYAVAAALCALATVVLANAGLMTLRSDAWEGSLDEWGPVATDSRQRLNFLLVSIGMVGVGIAAMWFGFRAGMVLAGVLLVGGGWTTFLLGFMSFVGWLQARRLFG